MISPSFSISLPVLSDVRIPCRNSSFGAPSRSLPAAYVHALACQPAAVRSTVTQLRAMGYSLRQAYALAVRSRQS